MKSPGCTLIVLTIFSIAMGYLESSVVVYLRLLYYPEGFRFPLVPLPQDVAITEVMRELATIVMLLGAGILGGKNTVQRFCFFLFCFAIWDIFYYVFLWLLLGWPESLFTLDILFLIPVPWTGPVLAPCLVSLTMCLLTVLVVYYHRRDTMFTIGKREWALFISGAAVLFASFIWDYSRYAYQHAQSVWTPNSSEPLFRGLENYTPAVFPWWLFVAGEILVITGIGLLIRRHRKRGISGESL